MAWRMYILAVVLLIPHAAHAQAIYAPFEVSGWIPYWRSATGTKDTAPHLDALIEVNPFVYTIKQDGTLKDNGALTEEPWKSFIALAKEKRVRVIPTIMTGNGALVHELLKDPKKRKAHIQEIVRTVKAHDFHGIDIDYEGKYAETRPYFSAFLKELYAALGTKWLMCTIESRTPNADRFETPPENIEFANDFTAINKYCDRVRIMTYDQERIDLTLNKKHEAIPYAPVADPVWVEKAIRLAMKDISKKKIVIGIPTYGYEYDVTAYSDTYTYDKLWAFNPGYALQYAALYNVVPQRTVSGELAFTYLPTTTAATSRIPHSTNVAASARSLAELTNTNHTFRMMVWSDAEAVRQKVELAKKLGVRGVALFKFDGGHDPAIWTLFPPRK